MRNLKFIFALVFTMVLSVTMNAQQSDDIYNNLEFSRQGIFVSVGVGGGLVQQKISYDGVQSKPENFLSLVGDMTVGRGFTEQITGFLTLKKNWYTLEDEDESDKMETSFEFVGIGGSYFFKSTANSPFVTAGVGIASQVIYSEENIEMNGLGGFLGIGYSVNENMSVKVEAIWGNPSVEIFDEKLSINTMSIGLSANYSF